MHRSGTSLVARILANLDFFIGNPEDLLPPNEANPLGYVERVDVAKANSRLLHSQGLNWHTLHNLSLDSVSEDVISKFDADVKKIVQKLSEGDRVAIKNPLMSVLLPLWQPYLVDPVFLICIRNPLEVGRSVNSRNNIPVSVGCALWELYTRSALLFTQGSPRLVLHYESLLTEPGGEISRLLKFLRAHGRRPLPRDAQKRAKAAIEAKLHRHRLDETPEEDRTAVSPGQLALYKQLREGKVPAPTLLALRCKLSETLLDQYAAAYRLSQKVKRERLQHEQYAELEDEIKRDLVAFVDHLKEDATERVSISETNERLATIEDQIKRVLIERFEKLIAKKLEQIPILETSEKLSALDANLQRSERRLTDLFARLREKLTNVEARVDKLLETNSALRERLVLLERKNEFISKKRNASERARAALSHDLEKATAILDVALRERDAAEARNRSISKRAESLETSAARLDQLRSGIDEVDEILERPLWRILPHAGELRPLVARIKKVLAEDCPPEHGEEYMARSSISNLGDRSVFISGMGRSGTTLLLKLLDGHPELMVIPVETMFFRAALPEFGGPQDLDHCLEKLRPWLLPAARIRARPVDLDALEASVRRKFAATAGTARDVLVSLALSWAEVTGQSDRVRWVEKTPRNQLYLDQMVDWFPDFRLLHVVRDPRGVFASHRLSQKSEPPEAENIAKHWQNMWRYFQDNMSSRPEIMLVRYEDLLTDTRSTMSRVAEFLGIHWSEKLLSPTENGVPWTGNSFDHTRNTSAVIRPEMATFWRQAVNKEDILAIEKMNAPYMRELGYALDSDPDSDPGQIQRESPDSCADDDF